MNVIIRDLCGFKYVNKQQKKKIENKSKKKTRKENPLVLKTVELFISLIVDLIYITELLDRVPWSATIQDNGNDTLLTAKTYTNANSGTYIHMYIC